MANKLRKSTQQILSVRRQTPEISNLTACFMVSNGNLGRRALIVKEHIFCFSVGIANSDRPTADTKIGFA